MWWARTCHLCALKSQDCFNRLLENNLRLRSSVLDAVQLSGPARLLAPADPLHQSFGAHQLVRIEGSEPDSDNCGRESRHRPGAERLLGSVRARVLPGQEAGGMGEHLWKVWEAGLRAVTPPSPLHTPEPLHCIPDKAKTDSCSE